MGTELARLDHRIIAGLIEPGARVLDLGCGDGELLAWLGTHKKVLGQGIEINEADIYKCVEKGVHVLHSDIDSGLPEYPDGCFDAVILNQTLQQSHKVEWVLAEALRVARKVIVGFPNFAHYQIWATLILTGRTPITKALPFHWYDSPNVHCLSIRDFADFCRDKKIRITARYYLGEKKPVRFLPNLLASNAIFVLEK